MRWLQRPTDTVVFTGTKAEARQWVQDQGGVFVERETPVPSPRLPLAFTLESTTPAQLDAEARRKKLREDLQARQDKPLIGTQGDIGQMDMLGGNDLFSAPAAKVSKAESGELRAESPKPIPASAELRIGDFGEKIGGARKDNAVKGEMERSAWAMVDTDTENSGAAAADMLQWQHDPALRAPVHESTKCSPASKANGKRRWSSGGGSKHSSGPRVRSTRFPRRERSPGIRPHV